MVSAAARQAGAAARRTSGLTAREQPSTGRDHLGVGGLHSKVVDEVVLEELGQEHFELFHLLLHHEGVRHGLARSRRTAHQDAGVGVLLPALARDRAEPCTYFRVDHGVADDGRHEGVQVVWRRLRAWGGQTVGLALRAARDAGGAKPVRAHPGQLRPEVDEWREMQE